MVLGKKLQPVIRNIVFDGNNAVKNDFPISGRTSDVPW